MTGRQKLSAQLGMSGDEACARCREAALVIDEVSMTLACSNCGHVVTESELVTFGDFWEGRPAGQQQSDEGEYYGVRALTCNQTAVVSKIVS